MPTYPDYTDPKQRTPRVVATIEDFSPGIYSDQFAAFSTPPALTSRNGAATIENTYRCCADPSTGSLGPLPRGQNGASATLIAGNANNAPNTYYPTNFVADYLLDLVVAGQLQYNGAADEIVATIWGAHIQPAGTGSTFFPYVITKYTPIVANTNIDIGFSKGTTAVSGITIPSAELTMIRKVTTGVAASAAVLTDFFATFAHIAQNVTGAWATGALSATEQGWTNYDSFAANYEDGIGAWFYPSTKNTDSHAALGIPSTAGGFIFTSHQGRIAVASFLLNTMDALTDHIVEAIGYTDVFQIQTTGGSFFTPADPPSSYCAIGSMSADELFIVKASGGAILIRGDLNGDYQLVRLPFVESTGGIFAKGQVTPIGFVYLTRRGVFAWSGGDTSTLISPQLQGQFFDVDSALTDIYVGHRGSVGYSFPWVLIPNSFAFDLRTQAWWRLEDTSSITPFSCYGTSAQAGKFYGGKYKKTSSDNVMWRYFLNSDLAYSYSWQSQPLVESSEYRIEVREIELIAQPSSSSSSSTVVITLSGYQEDGDAVTPVSVTFTLDATNKRPQRLRKHVPNFTAASVTVKIVADGNSAAAPKIYGPLLLIGQHVATSPYAS